MKPPSKLKPRERLLLGASKVFFEQGMSAPIEKILEAGDASRRSFYLIFRTREAFEGLVISAAYSALETTATPFLSPTANKTTVLDCFKALALASTDPHTRGGLIFQSLPTFPSAADIGHRVALDSQASLQAIFEKICRTSGFENPKQVSRQLVLLLMGHFLMARAVGEKEALQVTINMAEALVAAAPLKLSKPIGTGGRKVVLSLPPTEEEVERFYQSLPVRKLGPAKQ